MGDSERRGAPGTVIGPTFTVALPFSRITSNDAELRDAIAELASLVARLAEQSTGGDETELRLIRDATQDLAKRVSQGR
jgi:hypothetical protein